MKIAWNCEKKNFKEICPSFAFINNKNQHMQKLKVVKQLFTMTEAKAVAIFEREQARKNGRSFKKVDIVWAIELYRANPGMFGKMGKPLDEHFVVIVFYSKKDELANDVEVLNENEITVKPERENVTVNLRTFTVIKYVSKKVNEKEVLVIERYVILDEQVKQNKIIGLYPNKSKAS